MVRFEKRCGGNTLLIVDIVGLTKEQNEYVAQTAIHTTPGGKRQIKFYLNNTLIYTTTTDNNGNFGSTYKPFGIKLTNGLNTTDELKISISPMGTEPGCEITIMLTPTTENGQVVLKAVEKTAKQPTPVQQPAQVKQPSPVQPTRPVTQQPKNGAEVLCHRVCFRIKLVPTKTAQQPAQAGCLSLGDQNGCPGCMNLGQCLNLGGNRNA
jgi:hypothetical protein